MSSVLDFEMKHTAARTTEKKPRSAVLLFHGLTGSPFEMKKYAKYLYEHGHDIYCYSLKGHGEDMANLHTTTADDWINDAKFQYEHLRDKYEYFFLSGLCLGAVIALNLACEYKNITGVIGLSTTLFLDGWRLPWYRILMPIGIFTILRFYFTFSESDPYGIKCKKTRTKIAKLISRGSKNGIAMDNYPLTCIYELLKISKITRRHIEKITAPVLLIHSKEDDLTSPKSSYFVYKKIRSQKKELVILNNSYHMVLYDNEKEFVFEKSLEFIEDTILTFESNRKNQDGCTNGAVK